MTRPLPYLRQLFMPSDEDAVTAGTSRDWGPLSDRGLLVGRVLACIGALVLFGYHVHATVHWPVLWDGGVMHYIRFLLTRGFRPYADITDMNLPGCYLAEGWAMALFGWGDLGWRIYEYFLMGALAVSGAVIGGRRWMAGLYCALFFLLMHGSEGPGMAVERDEVMTVLLVVATACLFQALRDRRAWLMLPFGLCSSFAASMKPGAALVGVLLTGLAYVTVRRRGERGLPYVLWALGGSFVILMVVLQFLVHYHALGNFYYIAHNVLPSYVKEKNYGRWYLLRHLTPVPAILLVAVALVAALVRRERWGWERTALLLATTAGVVTYWLQAKGYLYHRYSYTAFLLLWVGWELSGSERFAKKLPRCLEWLGLGLLFLVASAFYVRRTHIYLKDELQLGVIASAMQNDLAALGGPALQHDVQCLDLVNGCLTALYHLRLVQNTGTTGDLLLFSPRNSPAVSFYRDWFWRQEQSHPPDVVVLGNEWYFDYLYPKADKLAQWPAYAEFLRTNYVPVVHRTFGLMVRSPAYTIFLRKNSAVLRREQVRPLECGPIVDRLRSLSSCETASRLRSRDVAE